MAIVDPAARRPAASRRFRTLALLTMAAVIATVTFVSVQVPQGPRTLTRFEPDRLAQLETQMWQAYYDKQRLRLFTLLVVTLREQYGYSWARAVQAGFHLARGAAEFGERRGSYDAVLPDLEAAYGIARDWTSSPFDPQAVARAELAWWVARRTPGQSDIDTVGRLIGEEYALLFSVPYDRVSRAARLRAEAGHLRDEGGAHADWARVHALLVESYRLLKTGVTKTAVTPSSPSSL